MAGSILGNRVLRKEDPKFLTTGGVYVDDLLEWARTRLRRHGHAASVTGA